VNYLVAVSGGIDSVVLLDMLVKGAAELPAAGGTSATGELEEQAPPELIVAHFDHGIRPDSAADARFVSALAASYGLPCVTRREDLGRYASEEAARARRYAFLQAEAKKQSALITTAHHADDVIETITINLTRGTGWRGIAVMDSPKVSRPLLFFTKQQIRQYALDHRLEWVEDSTNSSDDYLRNRIRHQIARHISAEQKQPVLRLWREQVELRRAIDEEVARLLGSVKGEQSRYFFIQIDPVVAIELLRVLVAAVTGHSPTRPQTERALLAVKTARPHTTFPLGGAWLRFGTSTFTVAVKTP
jgi:tRNA(Ile)-lysidine synthetase-like protein